MMRLHFDEQLHLLNEEMIRMGSMIERPLKTPASAGDARPGSMPCHHGLR